MKNKITVGIVGCGFIGGALKQWLETHNPEVKIRVSDPPKGWTDSLLDADVIFISIHIPTEASGEQDLTLLKQIIADAPDVPLFIRTTILPGTSVKLARETGRKIHFMPEFLTERTAYADFCAQPMIFTAEVELLKAIFVGKNFVEMSSYEAEVSKYAHNVFGALKVTYFNGVYDFCTKTGADYNKVLEGVKLSGYINDAHTAVPGPDGKFGYGGKCFPKDVNALTKMTVGFPLNALLAPLQSLNTQFRGTDK